ncbi:MAG: hypothetical protein HYV63_07120 [Candidatus Schekmanbacteria bacterium]|nr:hypothetical protein [Candidatus Schekmanbacteria bacterium]
MECGRCHHLCNEGANYCEKCGQPLWPGERRPPLDPGRTAERQVGDRKTTPIWVFILGGCGCLLVMAAIVGIIAAIAIPSLLRSRMSANEAAAAGALRTIVGAQTDFNNAADPHCFASSLKTLAEPDAGGAAHISAELGQGQMKGYAFEIIAGPDPCWQYTATAVPIAYQVSGVRSFTVDATGIIRGEDAHGAVPGPDAPEVR